MTHQRWLGCGLLGVAMAATVGCGATGPGLRTSWDGTALGQAQQDFLADASLRDARAAFKGYDLDRSGQLSAAELPFLLPETFQGLDRDGNGALTWDETKPSDAQLSATVELAGKALSAQFQALDRNTDGYLTALELQAGALPAEMAASTAQGLDLAGYMRALDRLSPSVATPQKTRSSRPPVVMVPGFFLPTMMWVPLSRTLREQGWTEQATVPHFPSFGDIREVSAAAARSVQALQARTGAPKVEVIGHSMGGLVLRYYIKRMGGEAHVAHYVSYGTPHHGTVVGYLWPSISTRQMRPGSDFLRDLNEGDETPGDFLYTSIRTNIDEIVPDASSPILEGAENHLLPFREHLQLALDPQGQRIAIEALKR